MSRHLLLLHAFASSSCASSQTTSDIPHFQITLTLVFLPPNQHSSDSGLLYHYHLSLSGTTSGFCFGLKLCALYDPTTCRLADAQLEPSLSFPIALVDIPHPVILPAKNTSLHSTTVHFFLGEDATLLIFNVNQPATLHALTRWWSKFRICTLLADEDREEYCLVVRHYYNKTDLISNLDNATTVLLWERMACTSSTSSFCLWIHDLPAIWAMPVTRETGYPLALSMDSTTTNCAYILLSQRVSFSWIRQAPTVAGTHAIPDTTNGNPEADMDPTPHILLIDLASHHHKRTSKFKFYSHKFPTQLHDA
ncbi:hypothetical protein BGW80DRAFT_1462419 [Lactifluus volemus]|nr:hypothetical protein BGW80DRAFT_1462419 [Lactifluus volemus]